MKSLPYVPLQVTGKNSLLHGTIDPKDLVETAARLGFDAIALTDRNSMMGTIPFVRVAESVGMRAIIGLDLHWGRFRATFLARNRSGYAALCDLVTRRHLEPERNPLDLIAPHVDHCIILCSDPELLPILCGVTEGRNLYGAVVRIPGHRPDRILRVAAALDLPCVATGDVQFLNSTEFETHRILRAIAGSTTIHRLDPESLPPREAGLLDPRAMEKRHEGESELLLASRRIAAECQCVLDLGRSRLPRSGQGDGGASAGALRSLAVKGAKSRYGDPLPMVVRDRLERELEVIEALDFPGYFLIINDIMDFARSRNIPVVGRGSAADSLVVYCLGFTRVDPLAHDLVFERFLSRSRRGLPDIDLDFCWRRRDEVIQHIYDRYGRDHVATISTHVAFRPRSAFREVAKAMGLPPESYGPLAKCLPHGFGGSLIEAVESFPECRPWLQDATLKAALIAAESLRGLPRHLGMHPGGMVISDRPITWYTPIVRSAKGPLITQHEMRSIEALGLVKMDILGHRSLTTIADSLDHLRGSGKVVPDLHLLGEFDAGAAELLKTGRTIGCFQVESPGMRKLLVEMRAQTRTQIVNAIALIRPGPASSGMKERYIRRSRGEEPVTPLHSVLEPVLRSTLGIMLYQEDILRVCSAMAGFSLEDGDLVRAALGKKKDSELVKSMATRYFRESEMRGIDRSDAQAVWENIGQFAAFGFCKAHAATYGYLAFEELYLKAHHPEAFFCAILNNDRGYYEDRVYLEEALRCGVHFHLPDINRSEDGFSLEHRGVRIGLRRVRCLSMETRLRLIEERRGEGPFLSLRDFVTRVRPNQRETRNLILAGAFDLLDSTRPELLWRAEIYYRNHQLIPPPSDRSGELFPFSRSCEIVLPRIRNPDPIELRRWEYAVLRMTAEGMGSVIGPAGREGSVVASEELSSHVGRVVTCFGWCSATRRTRTKDGRFMRFFTLEDPTGTVEAVFFPDAYEHYGHLIRGEGPYYLTGEVTREHDVIGVRVTGLRLAVGGSHQQRS
jgi:DNA-directed DNA polymerase III PolC